MVAFLFLDLPFIFGSSGCSTFTASTVIISFGSSFCSVSGETLSGSELVRDCLFLSNLLRLFLLRLLFSFFVISSVATTDGSVSITSF